MDFTIQAMQGANVQKPFVTSTISVLMCDISLTLTPYKPNQIKPFVYYFLFSQDLSAVPLTLGARRRDHDETAMVLAFADGKQVKIFIVLLTHNVFLLFCEKNKNKLCSMTCGRVPSKGTIENTLDYPLLSHYDFRLKRDPPKPEQKDLCIKEGVPLHSEIIVRKERVVQR